MVGVPGGSRGCNNCRQRKIKCGLQKPHCDQCIRRGYLCSGYRRELVFVYDRVGPLLRDKLGTRTWKGQRGTISEQAISYTSTFTDTKKIDRRLAALNPTIRPPNVCTNISPHKSYRQQLFNAYLYAHIPFSRLGPANEEPWLCLLPGIREPTQALETASMALCTAALGRVKHDYNMVSESHKLYTEGLTELQKALCNTGLMYKDETLGACMALAMYELTECPSKTDYGYVSHHNGCARLIQLRGSRAYSSGLAHQIFSTFRIQGILRTLETCQPNFLTQPKWLDHPWENISKSPAEKILDVLSMAPIILTRVHAMRALGVGRLLSTALEIMNSCQDLELSLQKIYEQLRLEYSGPLYWSEFSKTRCPLEDGSPGSSKVFPVAFNFPDLRMAKTMMYYWATQTILWSGMSQLSQLLHMLQPTAGEINVSEILSIAYWDDFISPARNVCQSIEYCTKDEMLSLGTLMAVAPLMIIAVTLKRYPEYEREKQWINFKLNEMRKAGVYILEYSSSTE